MPIRWASLHCGIVGSYMCPGRVGEITDASLGLPAAYDGGALSDNTSLAKFAIGTRTWHGEQRPIRVRLHGCQSRGGAG